MYIYYLYAVECLVKKYEEAFAADENLLNTLLQQSEFLTKEVFALYRSEQAEPFVPLEYHEKCIEMAKLFFEWFDSDDGTEEIEEVEEEDED